MSDGQRQHPRFPWRTAARVQLGDEVTAVETTTLDLSLGGLSLRFSRDVERDMAVTVGFGLVTGARLELRGRVRHCTAVVSETEGPHQRGVYVLGVELGDLAADEREAIEQACAALREHHAR